MISLFLMLMAELYDIDLIKSHKLLLREIGSIADSSVRKQQCDSAGYLLIEYCRKNNIELNFSGSLIIHQEDEDYIRLLAFSLISYPITRIRAFLDYQYSQYRGEGFFPSIIEGYVCTYIENFAIENTERLDRIMQWVEERREFISVNNQPVAAKIIRNSMTKDELKALSKRLWKKKCINMQLDFFLAIEEGKPTQWKDRPEMLARLIYRLIKDEKKYLKPILNKGFFKATEQIFDYGQKSRPKLRLSEIHSRLTTEEGNKPLKLKKIDSYINSIL